MDCRHSYSPLVYSRDTHPFLMAIRYSGLHALHRGERTEWRGYLAGHIRCRSARKVICGLRLFALDYRERIARRAILHITRRGWLGPEAAIALRRAIADGAL